MIYTKYTWKRIIGNFVDQFGRILFKLLLRDKNKELHIDDLSKINPKKILIIRSDSMGDVILSTPLFAVLRKRFSEAYIAVMVRSIAKDILSNNPDIDEVIFHDVPWNRERSDLSGKISYFFSKKGVGYPIQLFKAINYLKRKRFDVAIDLRGDYRNIFFFTYLIGARYRISFNRTGGSYFLTHSLEYSPSHHEIDKNFRIAQLFDVKKTDDCKINIYISKADHERVNHLLKDLGIADNDFIVVLHPGAKQIQRWRPERFGELGDRLIEMYKAKVLLTGVSTDKDLETKIKVKMKKTLISLISKTSSKELTALIKRINLLICNDTGVLHLASFMNTPTIALFGPTDPKIYSHNNITVIRKILPCTPCNIEKCIIKDQKPGVCMDELTVDDVLIKAHAVLSGVKGKNIK